MITVFIDPRCNIEYSAFYIKGLYDCLGKETISFDKRYFSDLTDAENFNFVLKADDQLTKYSIDYNDSPYINKTAYAWCSFYGKVNFRQSFLPVEDNYKISIIPPSFGIRIWSVPETLFIALKNYYQSVSHPQSIRKFLSGYIKQLRHLSIEAYQPVSALPDYIFSINTLWFSNEWIDTDKTVNRMRLNFYKAVSSLKAIRKEIGFVYSQKKNKNPNFQDYVTNEWIPKETYLSKTQQSVLVFNTPAWDLCHGWKLAEYLALGKAIISTPFHNELPVPLEHGKHIHVVSGSMEDIRTAVQTLLSDTTYRANLEKQSRAYYEQWVQPSAVLTHFLSNCGYQPVQRTSR